MGSSASVHIDGCGGRTLFCLGAGVPGWCLLDEYQAAVSYRIEEPSELHAANMQTHHYKWELAVGTSQQAATALQPQG